MPDAKDITAVRKPTRLAEVKAELATAREDANILRCAMFDLFNRPHLVHSFERKVVAGGATDHFHFKICLRSSPILILPSWAHIAFDLEAWLAEIGTTTVPAYRALHEAVREEYARLTSPETVTAASDEFARISEIGRKEKLSGPTLNYYVAYCLERFPGRPEDYLREWAFSFATGCAYGKSDSSGREVLGMLGYSDASKE